MTRKRGVGGGTWWGKPSKCRKLQNLTSRKCVVKPLQHHHDNSKRGGQWTVGTFNPCNTRPINMATRERGKGARHLTSRQAGCKSREGHCFGSNWKSLSVNKFHLFLAWKTFVTRAWRTSNRSSSWRHFWLTRVARVVKCLTNDCGNWSSSGGCTKSIVAPQWTPHPWRVWHVAGAKFTRQCTQVWQLYMCVSVWYSLTLTYAKQLRPENVTTLSLWSNPITEWNWNSLTLARPNSPLHK